MKKINLLKLLVAVFALVALSGCQIKEKVLNDGTFEGVSSKDDQGAYAKVKLEIVDHQIENVDFVTIQKDGSIKDEEYGKKNGEITDQTFYDKAQLAVRAMKTYQEQLAKEKAIDKVEVISGATISHNQFKEAVEAALKKAE